MDGNSSAAAPAECVEDLQTYQQVLPSQIGVGSQIRVTTRDGHEFIFSGASAEVLRINSAPQLTDDRRMSICGKLVRPAGGIVVGECMRLRLSVARGVDFLISDVVTSISAAGIEPDRNRELLQALLRECFSELNLEDMLDGARRDFLRACDDMYLLAKNEDAPPVVYAIFGDTRATLSAAILDLIKRARARNMKLSVSQVERIRDVFTRCVFDYAVQEGGLCQVIDEWFVVEDGQTMRQYKIRAVLEGVNNLVSIFSLEYVGEGDVMNPDDFGADVLGS